MKAHLLNWIDWIVDSVPLGIYCAAVNLRCMLRRKAHRISPYAGSPSIYSVRSNGDLILLCRRGRHNMHKRGVRERIGALAGSYMLDKIPETLGGTLIDCGANIGELGLWAAQKQMIYIPFEPETLEADCCDQNNFSGEARTRRHPLWKTDEAIRFFKRARDADGSVLENGDDGQFVELQARRVDSVLQAAELAHPIVFKVEAEGAEPEVLAGAAALLDAMDYVSVDCGYERGSRENPQHTFVETNHLLSNAGFEVVAANLRRGTFLFRRKTSLYGQGK